MLKIYALRFSVSRGWQWVEERICEKETADQWLAVFCKDEPNIKFIVSSKKPKSN